ncbi:MAG: S41 family peptidase [Saprospiraceae bacterium]|jgi:carboxyl-terminal processing protease|nr:S41 family peptidase [Saprospiraceae bacterium]
MEEQEVKGTYKIIQPLMLSACIAIGMMIGYKMNDKPENALISTMDYPVDSLMMTGRVEELIRFIENKYVDKVDSEKLIAAALKGVFEELDPHSIYLSPDETESVNDQMDGEYDGIGIENFIIDDTVRVSAVLKNSPAEKAGIRVFDKIISIDGNPVTGKDTKYTDVRNLLKQKPGTKVKILFMRGPAHVTLDVTVGEVEVKTVSAQYLKDIQTVLVKIDRFGDNTYREFMDVVELYFSKNNAKHIILDLRDNPGGFLPEATNILCQIFEEKERLLLYTEGRSNKKNEYKSTGKRFFPIDQVVVLIDENSASASEIIAGAIQDWDRGLVIGRRSFGKGLVQEQYKLNNGGAVRLTVARYFTPSGRSIQRDYVDRDEYDDDFHSRYQNGDLFHKDSTLIKNGGKYTTLLLKRTVEGSGGITPDLFVAMDSVYKNGNYLEAFAFLQEFSFRYAAKYHTSIPTDIKAFDSWILPDKGINELNAFIKANVETELIVGKDLWPYFKLEIKKQIRNILFKKENATDFTNDKFVSEAIKAIKNKKGAADFK